MDNIKLKTKEFLDDFNNALTQTLHPAGDDFIKLIFQNMGGKRITDKLQKRIGNLINSFSIQNSLEKIRALEGKQSVSGIYTSSEELEAFQIIKTMLVLNTKLKSHSDRINFRDYKGQFKIIVDEMPSKEICNLTLANNTKKLSINNITYELKNVSTVELSKYRKKLIDSASLLIE